MNRLVVISLLVVVAAVSSAVTVLIVKPRDTTNPLTEEQRAVREKFFGSNKELPPIKDGREMRPRW